MRTSLFKRPSPALVVSFIALVLVLGGTAVAKTLLRKNSVGTKQIKNGAVTSGKLHGGAVTTGKIKNGAVTASKINTSGLTVPNAQHATNASSATNATNATGAANSAKVDGMTLSHWKFLTATDGTPFDIFQGDGLTVSYECFSNDQNEVTATISDHNSELNFEGDAHNTFVDSENDGASTGSITLLSEGLNEGTGLLSYANPSGQTVSIDLGYDYKGAFSPGVSTNGCGVWGTATAS